MQNRLLVRCFFYLITFFNVFNIQAQCTSAPELIEVYGNIYYKCEWYYDTDFLEFLLTDTIEEPLECVVEFFDYSDTMYVDTLEVVRFSTDNNQLFPNVSPMEISIKNMDNAYIPGDRDAFRIRFHVENSCGKSNYVYEENFFTEKNSFNKYPDNDSCAIGYVKLVGPTTFSCGNQTNVYQVKYDNPAKLPDYIFRWNMLDANNNSLGYGYFEIDDSLVVTQWQDSIVKIVLFTMEECTCSEGIYFSNYDLSHRITFDTLTVSFLEGNDICGKISGYVKTSTDENCDVLSQNVPRRLISLNDNQYVTSDEQGYYFASVPYGTYGVSLVLKENDEACNIPDAISLTEANPAVTEHLQFKTNLVEKVLIDLFPGNGRVGVDQYARITLQNDIKPIEKGKLTCFIPDFIDVTLVSPTPDQIVGNQLIWDSLSFDAYEQKQITLDFIVINNAPLNDSLYWYVQFAGADSIYSDEAYVEIRNSYDPNAIVVSHTKLLVAQKQQKLKYTVHFQNTGNDTAYIVRVIDTLDSKIDLTTFELAGSSHPYEFTIKPDLAMEWNFPNINLLDSASNESASKGFFQFFAKLKDEVQLNDEAQSTAYIYFDTNDPIITNTVYTKIVEYEDVASLEPFELIKVFPNPTKNSLFINGISSNTTYTIHTVGGRFVSSGFLNEGTNQVSTGFLKQGVYYMKLVDLQNNTHVVKFHKI